jgi:hypothetical protein
MAADEEVEGEGRRVDGSAAPTGCQVPRGLGQASPGLGGVRSPSTLLEDMHDLRGRAAAGLLGHTDRDALLIAKAVHAWETIYKLGAFLDGNIVEGASAQRKVIEQLAKETVRL